MTEQEKAEIRAELEQRFDKKYKGCLTREDTQVVLKNVREKWFHNPSERSNWDKPMHKIFGNIIYWQVWELIRKLTCIICGCQYVRHLAGCSYAEEVAERLCKVVYELKTEYAGRSFSNVGDKKTPTAGIDFDYEAEAKENGR